MEQSPHPNPVSAIIGATSSMLAAAGPEQQAPWLFTRSWLAALQYESFGRDVRHLDQAQNDFDQLPADFPSRSKLAMMLAGMRIREGLEHPPFQDRQRTAALAEVANTDPHPVPGWSTAYSSFRVLSLMADNSESVPGFNPRAALAEVEEHAAVLGQNEAYSPMIAMARMQLGQKISAMEFDAARADEVARSANSFADRMSGSNGSRWTGARLLGEMSGLQAAAIRGDYETIMRRLPQLMEAARSLPHDDPHRADFERMNAMLGPFLNMAVPFMTGQGNSGAAGKAGFPANSSSNPGPAGIALEQLQLFERLVEQPGLSDSERAFNLTNLAAAEMTADTLPLLDKAAEHVQRALTLSGEHDLRRAFYLATAGSVYLHRRDLNRSFDDLATAVSLLEQAVEKAGSAQHAVWTLASQQLAIAYRISGRKELARKVSLGALRGYSWSVLLQSGAAEMHEMAYGATSQAIALARWAMEDNDPESAAVALDMGRGYILYAATETRDIDSRLTTMGERSLAQRWRQALATSMPNDMPTDLRRQVVSTLAGVPLTADGSLTASPAESSTRLLDPPSVHEIRAALRKLESDALVYLVPRDGQKYAGAAVIIPVDDEPSWMYLPELDSAALAEFGRYAATLGRAATEPDTDAESTTRDVSSRSAAAVDAVCDWAWSVAIGPLLEERLVLPEGRPARLVLIPMQDLARVPWHAARRRTDEGLRYALQDVSFSYAASARMLCASAWQSAVPLTDDGLVVGDPDTAGHGRSLPAARAEALAVHEHFYPAARYVGRLADGTEAAAGAGSRNDVLRWLADPEGGAMVHFACHGVVRSGRTSGPGTSAGQETSYLLLDGGRRLTAEELVDTLAARAGRGIGLAVLAACGSAESGRGYDEAFSLATTFLASGTRSVISAQWSVPDAPTSVLMFMVHHFLRDGGLAPQDALRAAQLWMLGERVPPESMPDVLRAHLDPESAPRLEEWAAFVHYGQ